VTLFRDWGIAFAGTAAIALAGVWVWRTVRGWRRKSPDEIERLRRLGVNACGRIIPGRIVEVAEPMADGPAGPVLLYDYEVAGVTYEAAQDVSALPEIAAAAPFLPGQTTSVKFDPRQPTNSILACEAWCGIPDLEPNRNALPERKGEPAGPAAKET
jgi:hypothetical protein